MGEDDDKLGKVEPTAEIRGMAHNIAELYASLLLEGFNEMQALNLVGNLFRHG